MTSIFSTLDSMAHTMDALDQDLSSVRGRGYRFGRDWEQQLVTLRERWPQQRLQATQLLESERQALQNSAREVETLLRRADRDTALVGTAESRVNALASNFRSAEARVRRSYSSVEQQISALRKEIKDAQAVLDALDTASFDLLPNEHPIAVCDSIWVSDREEPEGLLFLTDSRLIFEQRQEIATRRILFITTDRELVQRKLWESPIGAVEDLETEDQRAFLSRRELLTLRFSERTRDTPSDVTLQLKGTDNETWHGLIKRAKSGQIDRERFGAAAPAEQLAAELESEAAAPDKELPTACPNCNAPLPPIFRGMKQVTCDYCGVQVNI